MPAVASSTVPDCPPPPSSWPRSGQSATPSSQTIAWGDAGDSSVPLSPNRVKVGRSQNVPEEGSLFHESPVSPGFSTRPSQDAPQFPPQGVLLPPTMDDFSDSDLICNVNYFRGQMPQCPCRYFLYHLDSLLGRISLRFRLCWLWGLPLIQMGDPVPSLLPFAGDGPVGLFIPVHAIQRTPVCGWESSVWLAASSPTVGSPLVLFVGVLG